MSPLASQLTAHWVYVLGWTLVHTLWQGAVAALLAAAALALLRRSTAGARYLTTCAALAALALAPCVTAALLARPSETTRSPALVEHAVWPAHSGTSTRSEPAEFAGPPPDRSASATDDAIAAVSPAVTRAFAPRWFARDQIESALPWLVLAWLAGVLVLAARLLAGWVQVERLRRGASGPAPAEWQTRLLTLARRLRVTRAVRLLESGCAQVPAVLGWLRPVILVPVGLLTGLPPRQLELLLAHELAHIRRYDYVVNLVQTVLETLLFYQPAVWWLSRRIRIEREHCCDDVVLSAFDDELLYARTLAELEERRHQAFAMAATGRPLLLRIRRILNQGAARHTTSLAAGRWLAGPLALVAALMLIAPVYFVGTSATASLAQAVGSEPSRLPAAAPTTQPGDPADQAKALLRRMAEANRFWLFTPPAEVETYEYDFALGSDEPKHFAVSDPRADGQALRQAVSYYSPLHVLASHPDAASFPELVLGPDEVRLEFQFEKPVGFSMGNGISGTWRGFFGSRAERGTLVLDARRFLPLKLETAAATEEYGDYVEVQSQRELADGRVEPARYVPGRIRIAREGTQRWEWRFAVWQPGLWLLDTSLDASATEPPPRVLAQTSGVTINGQPAARLAGSPVPVAQVSTSPAVPPKRILSEGRAQVDAFLTANRVWLLPPLAARRGLAYEYRQEDPYRELIVFDDRGNVFAQLASDKENPGVVTRQLLYTPSGGLVRTERKDPFVRETQLALPGDVTGDALLYADQYVRNLATGLALDCALTHLARAPRRFSVAYEPSRDGHTYKLLLRPPDRGALFTGTMLAFTSWAYMHDVRYARSEIVVDAQTHSPLTEKDYDNEGRLVGDYSFEDYVAGPAASPAPAPASLTGAAPSRIRATVSWKSGERESTLQTDAEFAWVRPGVWLLRRVHSAFRDDKSESTGETTVLAARPEHTAAVDELLARLASTRSTLQAASAAPATTTIPFRTDAVLPAWTRAQWSEEAGKPEDRIIAVKSVRLEPAGNGVYKAKLKLLSTAYWSEYAVDLSIELRDSAGRRLADASPQVLVRAENAPALVEAEAELTLPAGASPPQELGLRATVPYMSAEYHGHGMWMQFMRPDADTKR